MEYSVLMTVYGKDNPQYFKHALLSMIKQSKTPDEIVLVKDGPVPRGIQDIIDETDKKYPNIIVQVQLPQNLGLGLALNEGIKKCKNELIARMDSDDISMPTRCEKQMGEFEKNPELDIVGCQADEFIGNCNNIIGCRSVPLSNKGIYTFARKRDPFNHPTVMYRKSKVEEVGCYSDLRKNQDTDLWIKMLLNNAICKNLPDHVFRFRFDENTYQRRKSWINTIILIKIRYESWKKGFNSFFEFLEISIAQIIMFVIPIRLQRFIYKKFFRKNFKVE